MRHFIVTGALLILLTVSRDTVRLHQSKAEVDAFKETEMDRFVHRSCFFSFLKESLFSPLPLYAAAMIYSAVTSWRPQLFLLAGRGPALSVLCHLSNLQQSTTPWEKNVNNPKMIER